MFRDLFCLSIVVCSLFVSLISSCLLYVCIYLYLTSVNPCEEWRHKKRDFSKFDRQILVAAYLLVLLTSA